MQIPLPTSPVGRIRVLLIDDHPFVRDGLAGFLMAQKGYEVIGEASNGTEGVEKMRRLSPDIVIVDLRLPDMEGSQVLSAVREMRWRTYAVVLSAFRSDDDLLMAARFGAKGYLLKTDSGATVLETITRVISGENMLELQIEPSLRQRLHQKDLTAKETLILRYVGRGMTNKEICVAMKLSENTVKTHLRGVYLKLGISNRAEASAIAAHRGLLVG